MLTQCPQKSRSSVLTSLVQSSLSVDEANLQSGKFDLLKALELTQLHVNDALGSTLCLKLDRAGICIWAVAKPFARATHAGVDTTGAAHGGGFTMQQLGSSSSRTRKSGHAPGQQNCDLWHVAATGAGSARRQPTQYHD